MKETNNIIWVQTYIYKKKVDADAILFCRAVNHKTEIHFYPEGKLENVHHSLAEIENILPSTRFFRCNRQYIVNLEKVDSYSEKILEVVLINGEKISLAKERKEELVRQLGINC